MSTSGKSLFEPLRMKETMYRTEPPVFCRASHRRKHRKMEPSCAALFTTPPPVSWAASLVMPGCSPPPGIWPKFCQMILDGGKDPAGDVLFPARIVTEFTGIQSPVGKPAKRGLGWDVDSQYSGNRGNLFPVGKSFGHTGFTRTSFWIDPASKTYVILLANSVHPKLRPAITPLRRQVATIAAEAVGYRPKTATGLDVLTERNFDILRGKHVGLITNPTGIDALRRRNIDLMRDAGVDLVALFSPEHGFAGAEDHPDIGDSRDPSTGLRVFSLYGKTLRPMPEMLKGIDTLVFDIQDLGVRFYTYETTMLYAMQEAAKAKIAFIVLDRPNPLTGEHVEGPMLDAGNLSFIGAFPLPLRHGLTIGELARMENAELKLNANLTVVEMKGWKHDEDWFDTTGLTWVNPSPNIRNLNESDPLSGRWDAGILDELFRGPRRRLAMSKKLAPNSSKVKSLPTI